MNRSKNTMFRAMMLCVLMIPFTGGCGAPVVAIAVWVGKVMLYTAAVKVTTDFIDQALGQKSSTVANSVIPNPENKSRGTLPTLTVGRKNSDKTPAPGSEVFTNVPVILSASGKWVVEQYYTDTVIEPRIKVKN